MDRAFSRSKVDVVHSNTLAVLAPALWARWRRVAHIWHVHEIIRTPLAVRRGFAWLLDRFSASVVFVSRAGRASMLEVRPQLAERSTVVWNGVENRVESDRSMRKELDVGPSEVLVVLAGRISSWKGQTLLVEAAEILAQRGQVAIRYLIIGSPPSGQDHWRADLVRRVEASRVSSYVSILDFVPEIGRVWAACDIAVVPSLEPEPFGLVAVEAMFAARPVIGARHGGLEEIIVDGETGLLFEPRNATALANAIEALTEDPPRRLEMGRRGLARAEREFSVERYVMDFESIYREIVNRSGLLGGSKS